MFDFFSLIQFEYPFILLIVVVFIACSKLCKGKVGSYYMPHIAIFESSKKFQKGLPFLLKWIAIIGAVIALASPIKELDVINNTQNGIDMVLSLDTSGSMQEKGFNPAQPEQNRWEVVQVIVNDFIRQRTNDAIGIVVFGTSVMTASALSYDTKAQNQIIENLTIGIVGEKTALINSIANSINILKQRETKTKIIIAMTDGEDTASDIPLSVVLKMAKKYNIKIYTIAIGGIKSYTLDQLSKNTSAKTFTASTKDDLEAIYNTIDTLEKSILTGNKIVLKEYYFFYPLMVSFLALLFYIYLKNRKETL